MAQWHRVHDVFDDTTIYVLRDARRVYAEVLEGAERNLGNTCEQRVAGPIAAGGTFKVKMQVSRYGSGGQRVLLIQRISNESVAP